MNAPTKVRVIKALHEINLPDHIFKSVSGHLYARISCNHLTSYKKQRKLTFQVFDQIKF